jgi:predicted glutamine amidotransferase
LCIAIYKPIDKVINEHILENCFSNNSDGAGFAAWTEREGLVVKKGFFRFEDFLEAYRPYAGNDEKSIVVLHFRIATHGPTNAANCHPFIIDTKRPDSHYSVAIAHNGVLTNVRQADPANDSDTKHFAERMLAPALRDNPTIWLDRNFKNMIEGLIGAGNKFAMIDSFGNVEIYNARMGVWDSDCWFSNSSFKSRYYYSQYLYGGDYGYGADINAGTDEYKLRKEEEEAWEQYYSSRYAGEPSTNFSVNDRRRFTPQSLGCGATGGDTRVPKSNGAGITGLTTEGLESGGNLPVVKKLLRRPTPSSATLFSPQRLLPTSTDSDSVNGKALIRVEDVDSGLDTSNATTLSNRLNTGFNMMGEEHKEDVEAGYNNESPASEEEELATMDLTTGKLELLFPVEAMFDDQELDAAAASIASAMGAETPSTYERNGNNV